MWIGTAREKGKKGEERERLEEEREGGREKERTKGNLRGRKRRQKRGEGNKDYDGLGR